MKTRKIQARILLFEPVQNFVFTFYNFRPTILLFTTYCYSLFLYSVVFYFTFFNNTILKNYKTGQIASVKFLWEQRKKR